MIELLYADITDLSQTGFERLCKTLSAERLNKVNAQKQIKDRYLSAAAGYLLQVALNEQGLVNPDICLNEHGKPYLKEGGVYFNLSHSGAIAVCAVSSAEVGVDVQQIKPLSDKLVKRVCTAEEYAFVMQEADGAEQRFCRLWAVKESVIKCLGKGLSLSPSRVGVNLTSHRITIDGAEANLYFKEFDLAGYALAVCTTCQNFSIDIDKMPI